MANSFKRFLSIALSVLMVVAMFPASVLAVENEENLVIGDEAGLIAFAEAVNSGTTYAGETVTLGDDITLTGAWTPIGNGTRSGNTYTGNAFKGTFDGAGKKISGLTNSLFGIVDGGTVKNLDLDVSIDATGDAAAAVAVLVNGTVSGIDVTGSVKATKAAGGVVARVLAVGTVENCTNAATVETTGSDAAAGIVAKAYYTSTAGTMTITGCENTGAATSPYCAGGIVGLSAADVSGCTNSGTVAGAAEAGGIVGEQVNRGTVSGNTNSADITGSKAGGIIGWIRYQTNESDYPVSETVVVSGNTNSASNITGDTASQSSAGGIVGLIYNQATVVGNTNYAEKISASTFAGGVVGGIQITTDNKQLDGAKASVATNVSTTTAENITANCTSTVVYNNDTAGAHTVVADDNKAAEEGENHRVVDNRDGTFSIEEFIAPKGNDFTGYTRGDAIWGEVWGNAKESFVIKVLDADGNVMGTTSLNNIDGIIDGDVTVTWSIKLDAESNSDGYWTMEWTTPPSVDNTPAKVELWVDGVKVSGGNVVLNAPDDLNKLYAAVVKDGKIVSYHTTLTEAIAAGDTVCVLRDVEEAITSIEGVTLTTNVKDGVTVTSTYTGYVGFNDVTVASGVSVNCSYVFSQSGENRIEGALNVSKTYYHGYGAKTIIQNGGKVAVGNDTTDGTTILRYNKEDDAGIYIYGDDDDSTVEFDCNYYIGFYSGTFYVEDANVEAGYVLFKNSYDDDTYADAYMTLDNSTITVVGTSDTQDSFIIDDKVHLTMTNSAIADVRDFNILTGTKLDLKADSTSTITATNVNIAEDVPFALENGKLQKVLAGEGSETDPVMINDLDDLKLFRDNVNAGDNFSGKYVKLTANIDLANEAWTPIGTSSTPFSGTFDGGDFVISNLYVDIDANNAGLFGFASVVKNLKINNAAVSGVVCVGAVAGELASSVGTVENCHVSGKIQITGENSVGGLVGKGYANIKNCSVIGDGTSTSLVSGAAGTTEEGDNIGGIIGHLGEGNTLGVNGVTVKNITVSGTRKVGGVFGTTARGNDNIGCTVDGVVVESTATAEYADDNASTTTIGGIVGNYFGSATSGGILQNCTVKNVTFVLGNAKSAGPLAGGDRVNNGGAPVGIDTVSGNTVFMSTITGSTNEYLMIPVAQIGETSYYALEEAVDAATAGDEIVLLSDVTLSEDLTLPAGITFNGNGNQINGTIVAGGDLTIAGHTKVTAFNAGFYDRTITIGAGACLEVTGTGRMTLGYGNIFNITGTIADAKTADKTTIQPSLIIPGGISITGGNNAAMNVTNAYVQLGNTSSKNSAANGEFTLNFTNSIAEFTNQLTLSEPTNGNTPTFVINVKDSVLTTAAKLCIAAPDSTVVIDNSVVTLGSYLRNSGKLTLKNGSELTGAMIQFGENGGNDGIITVDASKLTITNSSAGHAMDGNGTGKLILKNGATASVDYITESTIALEKGTVLTSKTEDLVITTEGGYVGKYVDGKYTVVVKELSGTGTAEDPYLIENIYDLRNFRNAVNGGNNYSGKYVKLNADINLEQEEWEPIGNNTNKFMGYFDGGDHTISNLWVSDSAANYAGLFGYIGGGAMSATATPTVKNLKLTDVFVSGNYYVGALAGQAYVCNITNVHVTGEVSGVRYVGGLVGHVYTYFENCSFTGDASCSFDALGGIAGAGDCRAYNCSVIGDITGNNWVGGIVGNGQEGTSAVGCYVKGTVSTSTNYYYGIGGIAGVAGHGYAGSEFKNNYFDGEVYLCGEKVDAIIMGIVNAADNASIGTTVEGNSWNTEYYDAETPVYVVAEISNSNATAEEWKAGASAEKSSERNNNLVVLESDIQYVEAESADELVFINASVVEKDNEALAEKLYDNSCNAMIGDTRYTLEDAVAAAEDGDTIVLIEDVTMTDGILITDKNITIDLNDKTFTVTEGASTNNRNFKIDGTSVVTIKNGTMVAAGDYSSGAYGTVRTEGTANVTLTDLKLYNYRGNGLNVKAYAGSTVTMTDVEVYAQYGGGIEAAGGTIELNNVTVDQQGLYTAPYNSMAISVNMGGKVVVNSGTYTTEPLAAEDAYNQGTSHGSWVIGVCNSGGTLIVNGGTFANGNYGDDSLATAARGAIMADTGAVVEINGGTFNALGKIIDYLNNLGDATKNPVVAISGGTFSAPVDEAYCAEGYVPTELSTGVYGVKAAQEAWILRNNVPKFYASLADAIADAQPGETIMLCANVTIAERITINKNISIIDYGSLTVSIYGNGGFDITNNAEVLFNNFNIDISNAVAAGDCIIGIGNYSENGKLTLDTINVVGDGYSSAYAVFYVYNTSELNIVNSNITLANDNSSAGGFIKAEQGKDGIVNITDTDISLTDAKIGFLDGTVKLDKVELNIQGGANAINQSALTVIDSTITVDGADGRALTLSQGDVTIENSTLNFSNCSEGEIRFKKGLALNVDENSTIAECDIYADASAVDEANVNGELVTGVETNPSTIVDATVTNPAYVAKIGNAYYMTLAEAFTAGGEVKLLKSVDMGTGTLTVAKGATVTLDLNGYTISGAKGEVSGNAELIKNKGTLTITDSSDEGTGTISFEYTGEKRYNSLSTISNEQGTLVVSGGTIENVTDQENHYAYSFAIDSLTNGTLGEASVTITGGTVKSTYRGIRQFANSTTTTNTLVINGGTVSGDNRAVWLQSSNANANTASTTISGGDVGDIYVWAPAGADASALTLAVAEDYNVVNGLPENYDIKAVDGVYGIVHVEAQIGDVKYATLQEAVDAAAEGDEIVLIDDIALASTVKVAADDKITLDLNGKVIDGTERVNIAIMSNGDLTITDSSEAQAGAIKAGVGTAGNAVNICGGTFTLESGTIYSKNNAILVDEQAAVINIKGGTITAEASTKNSAAFYISSTSDTELNITGGTISGWNGILLWNNTKINMNGGSIEAKGSVGIQGNGSHDNTEINISGDAVVKGYYAAMYHPQAGKLTISENAKLTGWTGVVVKGGDVNISGGTIIGNGAAADYAPVSSGFIDTGDGLYVEHYDNGNAYGTPSVTITGGTFESVNGYAVSSYANPNNAANGVEKLVEFVYGGQFKSAKTMDDSIAKAGYAFNKVNTDGYTVIDIADEVVAFIGTVPYNTPQSAFAAAESGDVIKLVKSVKDVGTVTLNAGVTVDGSGMTISGNSAIYIAAAGATVKNVNFENISNGSTLSAIYAIGLTGKVVIENNTFDTVDWDAIQITPAAGAEIVITGNTFEGTAKRYVHVQSEMGVDFTATVTGNKMYNDAETAPLDVYYFADADKINVSGNYIAETESICILSYNGTTFVNVAEEALPLKDENGNDVTYAVAVKNTYNAKFFDSITDALAAAVSGETVQLLTDLADIGTVSVPAGVTVDGNGKTISGNSALYINAEGATVKNVNFKNISNGNNLSAIYANGLTGTVVITGNTFDAVDWDAIQVTPAAGAEIVITGNTFTGTAKRYVHVESEKGVDFTATVTGNKMYNAADVCPLDVYYFADADKINVSGNYIADTELVCVLKHDGTTMTNMAEKALPLVDENGDELTYTIAVKGKYDVVFCNDLATAVAAATDRTIQLLDNATGAGAVIDKDVTIDFGGYTYTFTAPVGSTGTESNGLQILQGNTVVLKNGKLEVAEANKGDFYMLIQNYANLTVEDMILDGTNLDKYSATDGDSYVMSNNCGTVAVVDTTIIANDEGALNYALDACKYASYEAPVVTLSGATEIKGRTEVTGGTLDIGEGVKTGSIIIRTGTLNTKGDITATSGYAAIQGNGTYTDANSTTINITGGSVTSTDIAIYHPQNGTLNVSGGTITGTTGIEMRAGTLNVSGGTIEGTGEFATRDYGSGNTVNGAAVALSQHETNLPVAINITGGTIKGTGENGKAFYQGNHKPSGTASTNITATISGATIGGAVEVTEEGFEMPKVNGVYTLKAIAVETPDNVAEINGVAYESVSAALAAAKSGETVKLTANATENMVAVTDGVTLDLNGYTLTANYVFGVKTANVVDTPRTGVLKVNADNISLSVNNSMLPIWDDSVSGFVFSNAIVDDYNTGLGLTLDEENNVAYYNFVTYFNSNGRALLGDAATGADDNKVKVVVRLTWETSQGVAYQDFVYNKDMVSDVVTANGGKKYTLAVKNYQSLTNLTITAMVLSETNAEFVPNN